MRWLLSALEAGVGGEAYAQSRYRLTRSVVQAEWTPAAIRARQLEMAATAVQIWRIEDDGQ